MITQLALPLTSLVGLDAAVQSLLLLAIEPRLGGAVFAAPAGTGKSSLARGFATLGDRGQGTGDRGQGTGAERTQHAARSTQHTAFVELPLGADDEALLGGLDLEATLHSGQRVARSGLLARADGGVIYADQINLIADSAANQLLGALDSGEVRLERDGLSMRAPARFTLIGSYDPAEGQPRRHLLDRIGLWVALPATTDEHVRAEVVRRNVFATEDTEDTEEAHWLGSANALHAASSAEDLETLRDLIVAARAQLPTVIISDAQMTQLATAALAFGVEGHRADMFAAYAACAAAALAMRATVEQADLELAMRLVILPRATQIPAEEPAEQAPQNQEPQNQEPQQQKQQEQQEQQEQQNREPGTENQEQDSEEESDEPSASSLEPPEEQVFAALMADLPDELATMPFKALRRGRTGSRGSVAGKRGRHIRSAPGDPRRARIDIPATLRSAAPMQRVRGQGSDQSVTSVVSRRSSITLRAEDIRTKQYKAKAGALFLFAVDASGSMALHRMRQAKGAVHALLQRAYVHRDRVALLAFRGEKADLLLPPSQSVELARRALDLLPTGGGTPIAAALLAALDVAAQARGRGIMQTVLVLLTDGRANVGLRGDRAEINNELQALGRRVAEAGITALVVDTQRSYLSRGEARTLAGWLGGQYIYLPNAQGEQIAAMVGDAVRE